METPDSARHRPRRQRLTALLVVALTLATLGVGIGGVYTGFPASHPAFYAACGALSLARRGLPCDIPLPDNAQFVRSGSEQDSYVGKVSYWVYRVPTDGLTVRDYFLNDYLPQAQRQGWRCASLIMDEFVVLAEKSDRPVQGVSVQMSDTSDGAEANVHGTEIEMYLFQHANATFSHLCSGDYH